MRWPVSVSVYLATMSILIKTVSFFLLAYAALAMAMFLMQRQMLYPANTQTLSDSELARKGLTRWPTAGDTFRAYSSAVTREKNQGTVVVFHGNAGAAYDRDYYVDALEPLGYRVLLAEYPGYGGRSGQPGEQLIVEDARDTITLAKQQFGGPLFIWGESLGAGVAAAALADNTIDIDGLVLLTPWNSLDELVQKLYWFLPARLLLRDHYNSGENLKSFKRSIAVIVADDDNIIPNIHSEQLFESIDAPKELWRFDGAGHNTWPNSPNEIWWTEVMGFIDPRP